MNIDYLYNSDGKTSTYIDDKAECLNIKGNSKRYFKIENDILEANDYSSIVAKYEIKTLDNVTKLKELKCSRIRVIHFIYKDNTFVFLGTFIKDTQKTPTNIIEKNNKRIGKYLAQKGVRYGQELWEDVQQQAILLTKLKGDEKKDYYINFFSNCLIQSLKFRRKEEGLSQKEVAILMGVKQSYVSKMENLEKVPTIETIAKYCFALNFDANEIKALTSEFSTKNQTIPNFAIIFEDSEKHWSSKKDKKVATFHQTNSVFAMWGEEKWKRNLLILNQMMWILLN